MRRENTILTGMSNLHRRHFTLIELIVVIVVMLIIVGMTVPAFTRILQGSAVNHGASMVASALNLARVEACAKSRCVAVVFADSTVAQKLEGLLSDKEIYNKRAMRCCYVEPDDTGVNFVEWVPNTKWDLIPNGAHFDFHTSGAAANLSGAIAVPATVTQDDLEFAPGTGFQFAHAIVFNPLGKPNEDKSLSVVVMEGAYADNADADGNAPSRGNADNKLTIQVNRYTGNVNVNE